MTTREQVIEALRPIEDPEIHQSIVELGMVRRVEIDGGAVTVEIALTVPGCPLKDFFNTAIPERLNALDGVTRVDVQLGSMSEDERAALGRRLGRGPAVAETPFSGPDSRTRVVAVGSGKGGVGKSTISVNVAAALAGLGYRVGLLDADVWGFSIPRMLGLSGRPEVSEGRMIPLERHGLKVVSMGNFVPEEQPVMWRGPMLHKALTQFLTDVEWGDPDILIVDMPPGTGDVSISLAQMLPASKLVVVTTPQAAAMKVAERAARTSEQTKLEILGVVENMSRYHCPQCGDERAVFGKGGGDLLAGALGAPLLGRVPLDPRIMDAADDGEPFVVRHPDTETAGILTGIAERISAWLGAFAERRVFVSIGSPPR